MGSLFTDVDGSRIELLRSDAGVAHYTVRTHPLKMVATGESLEVAVASEPSEFDAKELVAWMRGGVTASGAASSSWVIGFDTESGPQGDVCVLQLCLGSRCVIVHARGEDKAPLSRWALRELIGNMNSQYVFAGAELAADALDIATATAGALRLHGGFDFTPRFAKLAGREGDVAGLRTIVDEVLTREGAPAWVKDKTVTCSDWSVPRLSLQQVKYAALDAWASARVGCHAIGGARSPLNLSGEVFTLRGVSMRVIGLLARVLSQAAALHAAQVRSHEVTVQGTEFDGSVPRLLTIRMRDYDRRLRRDFPVIIVLSKRPALALQKRPWTPTAPRGATATALVAIPYVGAIRIADGRVVDVRGKSAFVELEAGSGMTGEDVYRVASVNLEALAVLTTNALDRDRPMELAEGWAKQALRGHTVAAARAHDYPERVLPTWPAPEAGRAPPGLRFALALLGDGGRLPTALPAGGATVHAGLDRASLSLRLATRSAAAPSSQFSSSAARLVDGAIATLRTALPQDAAFAVGVAEAGLNPAQRLALLAAHTHVITGVRGPPGTGKTRIIAAMSASFAQRDDVGRVLILAPSNAATKRILESLRAAGVTDAALVVSREFFEEWHEAAYADGDIGEYLLTPDTSDGGEGATLASFITGGAASRLSGDGRSRFSRRSDGPRSRGGYSRRSDGRRDSVASQLLLPREVRARPSRWTRLGPNGAAPPTPRIVIMSHGSFAMATLNAGPAGSERAVDSAPPLRSPQTDGAAAGGVLVARSWGELMRGVIRLDTLRAAIVDEVSQLWNGYLLHLCSTPGLRAVKRLVLVGDEHQLPPSHGEAIGAASVFDALLAHPDVPVVELTTTYRLHGTVCDELSRRVYTGRLSSSRNAATDAHFRSALSAGLTLLQASPNGRAYAREIAALRRMEGAAPAAGACASVAWADVHGEEAVGDGGSMSNAEEAVAAARLSVAARLALALATPRAPRGTTSPPTFRVVVLTFYKEQQQTIETEVEGAVARLLRDPSLPDSAMQRGAVRSAKLVTTTDGFQGQEAELVIVSTVRSRAMLSEFMLDYRRCNVALSRASQAMLVVGSHAAIAAASHERSGRGVAAAIGGSRGSLLTHLALRCAADRVVFPLGAADSGAAGGGGGGDRSDEARRAKSRAGGVRFSTHDDDDDDGYDDDPAPNAHGNGAVQRQPLQPQPSLQRPRSPPRPLPVLPPSPPLGRAPNENRRPSVAAEGTAQPLQSPAVVAALRAALGAARSAGGDGFLTSAQLGQALARSGLRAVGQLSSAVAALPGVECMKDSFYGQHRFRLASPSRVVQPPPRQAQQQSPVVVAALRAALSSARAAGGDGFLTSAQLGQALTWRGLRAALVGQLTSAVAALPGVECMEDPFHGQHRFRLAPTAQPDHWQQLPVGASAASAASEEADVIAAALHVLREHAGRDDGGGWMTGPALGAPVRRRMEELGQSPYRAGTLFAALRGSADFEWRDEGTSFAAVRAAYSEPQPPTTDDVLDAARAALRAEADWVPLARLGMLVAVELRERGLLRHQRGALVRTLNLAPDISQHWGRSTGEDVALFRLRRRRRR